MTPVSGYQQRAKAAQLRQILFADPETNPAPNAFQMLLPSVVCLSGAAAVSLVLDALRLI